MSNLDGISFFGDRNGMTKTVEDSIISFLNHGFLELGAYIITPAASGTLTAINHITGIVPNTVFAAPRGNWVYENDFQRKDGSASYPATISGVLVNGSFVGSGSSYYVDYPRGWVVFNAATTGSVKVPYASKFVSVYRKESNEYRNLIAEWTNSNIINSGSILEPRAYLPAVFVDAESYETVRGTEVGSRSKLVNYDISFHIFTMDGGIRNQLQDICYFLETKSVPLLNFASGYKPLNYRGEFTYPSGLWTSMSNNYRLAYARFDENARVEKRFDSHLPLKYSKVTVGLEFDAIPI